MVPILLQAQQETSFFTLLLTVFLLQVLLAVVLGIWVAQDARKRAMRVAPWTACLIFSFLVSLLGGLILLILYLNVRNPPNAMMPPPASSPPASGAWANPPVARPAPTAASATSKVRCPRCQNIFEFIRQPQGPTQVKCPNCGMEGTI